MNSHNRNIFLLIASFAMTAVTMAVMAAYAADKTPPDGWQPVTPLLAGADVKAGKKTAHACLMCHNMDKGGHAKVGPDLYGIVNRPAAEVGGFHYSDAMQALHDKKWTYEALDLFLFGPKGDLPGTRMMFPGIKDTQKRADLIAYLRTLADKPEPLPETGTDTPE